MTVSALDRSVVRLGVFVSILGAAFDPPAMGAQEPLEIRLSGRVCTGEEARIVAASAAGSRRPGERSVVD